MADSDPQPPAPRTEVRRQLADNPAAPRIFAHDAVRLDLQEGVVSMTFAQHDPGLARASHAVTGRVLMPAPAAQRLAMSLISFLVKHGLDPTKIASADE